jgi:hypothetical protein
MLERILLVQENEDDKPSMIIVADRQEYINHFEKIMRNDSIVKKIERGERREGEGKDIFYYVKATIDPFYENNELGIFLKKIRILNRYNHVTIGEIKNIKGYRKTIEETGFFLKLLLVIAWIYCFLRFRDRVYDFLSLMEFFQRKKMIVLKTLIIFNVFFWTISMLITLPWIYFLKGQYYFIIISFIAFFMIPFLGLKKKYVL